MLRRTVVQKILETKIMKYFLILAVVAAVSRAEILLSAMQVTDEILNDPRYLLYEREDGLFEVEDLYNTTGTPSLFATENDVTFYFFTPQNKDTGVKIKESQLDNIVRLTGFNTARETLIVIHGWKSNSEAAVNDLIKNAALQSNNINVIVVDWSPIASKGYIKAQGSVLGVGNYIGDFLVRLDRELNHRLDRVTIVGHSLGAHIAGNAGAKSNGEINTIIGLDPAGPLFSVNNIDNRLDPTDAGYVHVIHTNAGLLGFSGKLGHVDYFPNGGKSQPGCGLDLAGSCSHSRAYEYFSESLNNNGFGSKLCGSYDDFKKNKCDSNISSRLGGFPVQASPAGNYYLTTNSKSPFAQG